MKKVELLSPAGNFDALKMAVNNGCDAVYIGGKKFGARAFSNNFTDEELLKAINYCHLLGVKVYVTVNTIIYENEIENFINYIDFLHKNKVDAVILQDLGMASLIHQVFPNLELHASTQMNIHTVDQLKLIRKLGFKRAVLAREVDFDTIKKMKEEVDIELEVFVHGALCISYSGQCLLSYMVGGRSGNRGECAGICRQPYDLYKNDKKIDLTDKYLLSTKDLCLIDKIEDLIKIGIDSFKIEGRMKSPEYVGIVTRNYRKKIDKHLVSENDINNMKKIFYRGYTLGKIFKKEGKDFINGERPNHLGYLIGEVIDYKNGKAFIKLDKKLLQGDGIRILSKRETGLIVNKLYFNKLLTNKVTKGIAQVEIKEKVFKGDKVYKTYDKELTNFIKESTNEKKIPLRGYFYTKNCNIIFNITDGNNNVEKIIENVIFKSKNKPTTVKEIEEKLTKLGGECFIFTDLKIEIEDNIFIPIKEINNLRRTIINELKEKRLNSKVIYKKEMYNLKVYSKLEKFNIRFETNNIKQIEYLIKKGYIVYTSNYLYYLKNKNDNLIYINSRVSPIKIDKTTLSSEISNINNNICDSSFNAVNSYSVALLHFLGAKKVTTSYEINIKDLEYLINNYKNRYNFLPNLEAIIYGKPEVMISKHCILKTYINKNNNCNVCKDENNYYLVDKFNNKYKLKKSNDCLTRLIDYKKINYLDQIEYLKNIGVSSVRIILDDENLEDIDKIIQKINIL